MAMRFDTEEMTAAFGDANDFDSVTRNMVNVGLDPWYTYGDERYFRVINGSGTANVQIDMSLLYDRYYDRAESLPEITNFEVVEAPEPEPCPDGSQPPCAVATTRTRDIDEQERWRRPTTAPDTNSDVGIDETGVAPIDVSQSEEDDVADRPCLLFVGIIAVLLGALYLVSRGGEDALAAEVQIEKMWDEQEASALEVRRRARTFVPAPPHGTAQEQNGMIRPSPIPDRSQCR